ncbi:MAG: Smr/MutS family protein [Deltaproteobacteria bacterium]|nr:Smr/MutS family protein [Deltaproteobacteria bacterium]
MYGDPDDNQPITIPLEDTLDLHTFLPKEVPSLLEEYLAACDKADILEVRIIHGKGKGILREKVHSFLEASPLVKSFHLGGHGGGEWGATIAYLKKR